VARGGDREVEGKDKYLASQSGVAGPCVEGCYFLEPNFYFKNNKLGARQRLDENRIVHEDLFKAVAT
jgi:hypothetical protein